MEQLARKDICLQGQPVLVQARVCTRDSARIRNVQTVVAALVRIFDNEACTCRLQYQIDAAWLWCGVVWRDAARRGAAWRGVAQRGVAWRRAAWRGVQSEVGCGLPKRITWGARTIIVRHH